MINVCFFTGDITRSGGAERVATTVANGLSQTGKYGIYFLSLVEQSKEPFFHISPEIRRFVLKKDKRWVSPGGGYLAFIPMLRQFLKRQAIDIIVDVDLVLDVLVIPASIGLHVKMISWEHFNFFFERSIGYRRIIIWLSVNVSDYIVTLTERDRFNYSEIAHRKERIVTIDNPINMSGDMNAVKEKFIITVGQLSYGKGIDMLAQIVPGILEKFKDWKWFFLGEGEYMRVLMQIRRRYKLEERLIMPGVVKNVEYYLSRSSIMVMASRGEGFGMCLLEARQHGVPCIAFDVPVGPLELIAHGVNGFLIPPFNLEDMKKKIMLMIYDDALRARFMNNAMLGLGKFQLEAVLKKWEQLLDYVGRS